MLSSARTRRVSTANKEKDICISQLATHGKDPLAQPSQTLPLCHRGALRRGGILCSYLGFTNTEAPSTPRAPGVILSKDGKDSC